MTRTEENQPRAVPAVKSFVHNVIAHPLWWMTETAADAGRWLHDATAPDPDVLPEAIGFCVPEADCPDPEGDPMIACLDDNAQAIRPADLCLQCGQPCEVIRLCTSGCSTSCEITNAT